MKKVLAGIMGMMIAASAAGSTVIFSTDFESAIQEGTGEPIEMGATVAPGVTVSTLTKGDGINVFRLDDQGTSDGNFASDAVGTNIASNLVSAVEHDAFFEFTLSSEEPLPQLGVFSFTMVKHGFGPFGGITLRSSVDNYGEDLVTVTDSSTQGLFPTMVDLSDFPEFKDLTSVTFRFYIYDEYEGQNNRRLGIDDLELVEATPPPPPVYGTILEEDFSEGRGDWALRANQQDQIVFSDGVVRIGPNPNNGQPSSIYMDFDTVTLLDGETLRFTVDVATDSTEPRNRDIRVGIGRAIPPVTGESSVLAVPMNGYLCTLPSGGASVGSRVWWIDAEGGTINFFNASTSIVGDFPQDDAVSATDTLKTWVVEITRSGDELIFSGSLGGVAFDGTLVASGSDVIDRFRFNTVALAYAYGVEHKATFDNVKLERFAAITEPVPLESSMENGNLILSWPHEEGRTVTVWSSTNLVLDAFSPIAENVQSSSYTNSMVDPVRFFRISAD